MSWGCAEEGGDGASALQHELSLSPEDVVVEDILSNEIAFLAKLSNGSYVGWGHSIVIPTPGTVLFNAV